MSKDIDNTISGFPTQGWKQFLTAKKEMLDAYDKAKTQSKAHKVEVYHGKVAEAEFRKWLTNFLPKKYGVTSGYIISQGISDFIKAPHFDVIIYEQLESPILWIEDNPDTSEQGSSRAIPAEYVKGVIEVKSAFKTSTVNDALTHLTELNYLLSEIDKPEEIMKKFLPKDFFCAVVFFELRNENKNDLNALNLIAKSFNLRGFIGGIVLRGEGKSELSCGRISLVKSNNEVKSSSHYRNNNLLSGGSKSDFVRVSKNLFIGSLLCWLEINFAQFAFDLIAIMNGTFQAGRSSSFHAFGDSGLERFMERKLKEDNKLKK